MRVEGLAQSLLGAICGEARGLGTAECLRLHKQLKRQAYTPLRRQSAKGDECTMREQRPPCRFPRAFLLRTIRPSDDPILVLIERLTEEGLRGDGIGTRHRYLDKAAAIQVRVARQQRLQPFPGGFKAVCALDLCDRLTDICETVPLFVLLHLHMSVCRRWELGCGKDSPLWRHPEIATPGGRSLLDPSDRETASAASLKENLMAKR